VEGEAARQLLNQQLTLLRSALEARGLEVERLDVRLAEAPERGAAMEREESGGEEAEDDARRKEAPWGSAEGGAAADLKSPEGDDSGPALEAPAKLHPVLQLWQQAGAGGAQSWQIRLDAIA
jgi:hypothetical protein